MTPSHRPLTFPIFVSRAEEYNLRLVAPCLWVGAERSPTVQPQGRWRLVVDLYGDPFEEGKDYRYEHADELIHWPFIDGDAFPTGLLDFVVPKVHTALAGCGPVLIHCQAGLSRSASTAYALLRLLYGFDHETALARVFVEHGWPRATTIASARAYVGAVRRMNADRTTKSTPVVPSKPSSPKGRTSSR